MMRVIPVNVGLRPGCLMYIYVYIILIIIIILLKQNYKIQLEIIKYRWLG